MVSFNGVSLESLDSSIRIIDVIVGPPTVNPTTIDPAFVDGQVYARSSLGSRPIVISFVVMDNNMTRRRNVISKIVKWARIKTENKMVVPQESAGYINAVCTELPPNAAGEYWQTLQIVFTAFDPYFYATSESSANVGKTFTVLQADNPPWRIEQQIGSTITSPAWELNNEQISFSTLIRGKLVLDQKTQTALLDGKSTLANMMLGSRFFKLQSGQNYITAVSGAGGTVYWRERWV